MSSIVYKANFVHCSEPFATNRAFLVEYVVCVLCRSASVDYEPVYLKQFCFHLPRPSEFSTIEGFTSQRQVYNLISYVFAPAAYRFTTKEEVFASPQINYE
ncbi:hypothetical protein [Sphingobacterium sp. HMA12]|uniref:hypothetical protein n=1 Tax=Sphingobacterium sp. HMA12 TaxID=2050894 RepID=UPI001F2DF106|nr:hypothetical protein [Sphingobacterium sp. HMA12]